MKAKTPLVIGVVGVLTLGAAITVALIAPKAEPAPTAVEEPINFPHATHIKADVDCLTCHAFIFDPDEPRTPTFEMCMECHDEPAEGEHSAALDKLRQLAEKDPEGKFNSIFYTAPYVAFPHARHVNEDADDLKLECIRCHTKTLESMTLPAFRTRWVHKDCLGCHLKQPKESKAHNATYDHCMSCHRA